MHLDVAIPLLPKSWKVVALPQLLNQRPVLVLAYVAVVVRARRMPDGQKPLQRAMTHDRGEVSPHSQIPRVLTRFRLDNRKRALSLLVPEGTIGPYIGTWRLE